MVRKSKEADAIYMREYRRKEARQQKFEREKIELLEELVYQQKKLLLEFDLEAINANCEHERVKLWAEKYLDRFLNLIKLHDRKVETLQLKYEIKGDSETTVKIKV